jgi:stalled ribosome alternative rescue factor ArfA
MKIKTRVNKQGFMGSAVRQHKTKKGKGSFRRKEKHQKKNW